MTKLNNLFTENRNWRTFKRKKDILNGFMITFAVGAMLSSTSSANAAPTGGNITQGAGSISQNGANTNINQQSQNLDINWQTFSSGVNEAINFSQPSVSAIAVNRVIGGVPSVLQGALNANGNVFILNNSGITFSGTSRVNVGSLLATTAKDLTLNNGKYEFTGADAGIVANFGNINVSNGGFAVLAAPQVNNAGYIQANLGRIELASTTALTLDLRGDNLITYTVSEEALKDAGVTNTGTLVAQSGLVAISTNIASDLVSGVVNLGGIIDADAFGKDADGGTVLVKSAGLTDFKNDATITARGGDVSGDGGFVEVSGKNVIIAGDVDTRAENGKIGTLLIDPATITIEDGAAPAVPAVDTLYEEDLENQATSIIVEADESVTINDLTDNVLDVAKTDIDKSITIKTIDADGTITADVSDIIRTIKGNINLEAGTITVGDLETGGKFINTPGEINVTTKNGGFSAGSIQILGSGGDAKLAINSEGDVLVSNIKIHNIENDKSGDVIANADARINSLSGSVTIGDIDVKAEANAGKAIDVIIEYLNTGTAAFNNSYGYYYVNDAGEPVYGTLLYEDISALPANTEVIVTVENRDNIGFFLIADGERVNSAADGTPVVFRKEDGAWNAYANGEKLDARHSVGTDPSTTPGFVLFDKTALNEDGIAHVQDLPDVDGTSNWEDLHADSSDLDYNDGNFNISTRTAEGGSADAVSYVEINAQSDVTIRGKASSDAKATSTNGGDNNHVNADARLYINAGADANLNETNVNALATQDEGNSATSFAELRVEAGTKDQKTPIPVPPHEEPIDHSNDFTDHSGDVIDHSGDTDDHNGRTDHSRDVVDHSNDFINHDGDVPLEHKHEQEYELSRAGSINIDGPTTVRSEARTDKGEVRSSANSSLSAYDNVNIGGRFSVRSDGSNSEFNANSVSSRASSVIRAGSPDSLGDVIVSETLSVDSRARSNSGISIKQGVSANSRSSVHATNDIIFNADHSVSSYATGNTPNVTSSASIIENAGNSIVPSKTLDNEEDSISGDVAEVLGGNIIHTGNILIDSGAFSFSSAPTVRVSSNANLSLNAKGNVDVQNINLNSSAIASSDRINAKTDEEEPLDVIILPPRPISGNKNVYSNVNANIHAIDGDVSVGGKGIRLGSTAVSGGILDPRSSIDEPAKILPPIFLLPNANVTSNVNVDISSAEGNVTLAPLSIRSAAISDDGGRIDTKDVLDDTPPQRDDELPTNNVDVHSDVDVRITANNGDVTTNGIRSSSLATYTDRFGGPILPPPPLPPVQDAKKTSSKEQPGDVTATNDIEISGGTVTLNGVNGLSSDANVESFGSFDALARTELSLNASDGDLVINSSNTTLESNATSNNGSSYAHSHQNGSATDNFLLNGSISTFSDADTKAHAKSDNESGKDGSGDWNQTSGKLTSTAISSGNAHAIVRGAAPEADDLILAGDDATATTNSASRTGKFTDSETVGSDTAELIFRGKPTSSSSSSGSSGSSTSSSSSSSGGSTSSGSSSSGGSTSGSSSSSGGSSSGPVILPPVIPPKVEEPVVVPTVNKNTHPIPVIVSLHDGEALPQQSGNLNDLAPAAGGDVEGKFCSVVNVNGSKICN